MYARHASVMPDMDWWVFYHFMEYFYWFSFVFLVFDVLNHLIGSKIVPQILSAVFDDCRYGCVLDESFPGKTEADTTSSVASGDLKILFLAVNAATS